MAIRIDNSEAKTKLTETKEQISALRDELKQMDADGRKNTAEYKDKKAQLDKLNNTYAELRKEVGKTALSYDELRAGARKLKREMDKAIPDTENWRKLREDYIQTKQRMKDLEVQATETRFSISKIADGFNKYAAMGAGLIASLTGVVLTARQCVDEFAKMEEAESQVRKYTGMAREEVKALNEEFKRMDTRTSREKLNALAGDAGRLGITGKKDVMDFVDAANMINVALGEDLGEDAVKNIGKLAQMFGEDKTMGLRGAMLATGSAVNAVGQASSAAEGYLVGFTARVAGASKQAGIAQGNIIGYAAVLDQNMQQQEMAATAFQTLLMKMYQEPAKFAKLAGQNVKEFTALIKTDANEAILQFLGTLNKKGGLDKLAPMFKEMGLDGVRASGVISTMAGKIDDIRTAQKLANQAYREGTSIINEYNVQNTTVQAELDKAKKHFADVRVELGEKLMPITKHMITTGSMTVKGLKEVITLLTKYSAELIYAASVIGIYIAALKLQTFWKSKVVTETGKYIIVQKLEDYWNKSLTKSTWLYVAAKNALTGNFTKAGIAMKLFFSSMSLNPIAAVTALVVAAAGAIYLFVRRSSEAASSIADFYKESAQERGEMDLLYNALLKTNIQQEERKRLVDEFNSKFGKYLSNLLNEKSTVEEIKSAYSEAVVAMNDYYARELLNKKTANIYEKHTEKDAGLLNQTMHGVKSMTKEQQTRVLNIVNEVTNTMLSENVSQSVDKITSAIYSKIKKSMGSVDGLFGGTAYGWEEFANSLSPYIESVTDRISKVNQVKDNLAPFFKQANQQINELPEVVVTAQKKTNGSNLDDSKDKKPWEKRLKAVENTYQQELLITRRKSDELGQTENEYQLTALQKELEYQSKRLSIIKAYQSTEKGLKHREDLAKLENDAQASSYNALKNSENARLSILAEYRDRSLSAIDKTEKEAQLNLAQQNEHGEIKERDYQNRLTAIELLSAYNRLEIAKQYQETVSELEFKNGETKAAVVKEAGDAVLEAEKQISEKRAEIIQDSSTQIQNFNRSLLKSNGLASTKEQLSALESFYQSQVDLAKETGLDTTLITSSYEESKRNITEKGAEERAEVIRKYELKAAEDSRDLKLKVLEDEHKRGLLSEEEYEIAKNKIANDHLQKKLEANEQYFNAVRNIAGSLSSAIQGFQDAEISKVSRKYDKQINKAKKAGKDTTKLEAEKEEAVSQVKKKYADKQFAAAVLQITASTAVAAMEAYKAMAGIPVVGPALGAAAAAAAIISGAAQIAVAKEQRDEAKGLKSGGYSDDYIQGYTSTGNPDDVAGVIPVHKNEFVTNHDGVANPHVKQFLDVFDVAQKNGSIRMINTSQILEQVRTKSGKYSGGYSEDTVSNAVETTLPSNENKSQVVSLLVDIKKILGDISDKEWTLDPRKVRDAIKRVETLESNVSRS